MTVTNVIPKLEVRVPIVRLRLADLTFLRGLCEDKPTCVGTYSQKDRLKLLGLIEDKEFPPCPKIVAAHKKAFDDAYAKALVAWKKKDWDALSNVTWILKQNSKPLVGQKRLVITKEGLEILRKGGVTVKMRKGCA